VIAGVVLAGGAGRRMGGIDKPALHVAGVPLLDRVLGAARPVCDRLVVVGPTRTTGVDGVTFVQEAEPGGGPVPAIKAGVAASPGCDIVVVLAADLPLLSADHLRRLLLVLDDPAVEAAAAAGPKGPNPLLAAYRLPPLAVRAARLGPGTAAGRLLPPATVAADLGPATFDVNRPEDLATAEVALASGSAAAPGNGTE
jgi:molybdopterin-guanine dinucleotide biosynthesis protein A